MSDDEFDTYVDRIRAAANREATVNILLEFREAAYLSGRHNLIDAVHSTLKSYDDR